MNPIRKNTLGVFRCTGVAKLFLSALAVCCTAAVAKADPSVHLEATGYPGANGGANCPGVGVVRDVVNSAMTYCYEVTNTGTEPLSNIVIADPISGFSTNIASLAVGASQMLFRESIITGDVTHVSSVLADVAGGGQVEGAARLFVDATQPCPGVCFVVSDIANAGGPDVLYSFDIFSGSTSLIGPIVPDPPDPPNANCLESLTFSIPVPGDYYPTLYSVDAGPSCGSGPGTENQGYLGTIDWDPTNAIPDGRWTPKPFPIGTGTGVVGRVNLNNIDGLDFDATQDGVLYAVLRTDAPTVPDLLFQIDSVSGQVVSNAFGLGLDYVPIQAVTNQAGRVLSDIDDIAIGTFDGVMYGVANASGTADELVVIDKFTGEILFHYPLLAPDGITHFQDMEGLSFDPIRGELYGSSGTAGGATRNSLFKINIVPPLFPGDPPLGQTTLIGPIPGTGDYEGLDCFLVTPETVSTIDGVVFWDPQENGFYTGSEIPVENAVVELWVDVDQNGLIDPLVDYISRTETTAADGRYTFSVIIDTSYIVRIVESSMPPLFYRFTTPVTESIVFPNSCGVNLAGPDFGILPRNALGDFVWDDLNQDGIQDSGEPGIPGVTVRLLDELGGFVTNTVTDASGFYLFPYVIPSNYVVEVVPPPGYIGSPANVGGNDTVDNDFDPTTFRTGIVDMTPNALPGYLAYTNLTVDAALHLVNDVGMIKTAAYPQPDNGSGNLTFDYILTVTNLGTRIATNILVSDVLPTGIQYVSDDASGNYVPATRTWTAVVSSLAVGASVEIRITVEVTDPLSTSIENTACVEIGLPDADSTNDCDTFGLAVLGNRAWRDANGNGIQDAFESGAGVPGVQVALVDTNGTVLATTTTDANGEYYFNLPAGEYAVIFTPPAGSQIAPQHVGGDGSLDSDPDPLTGRTQAVTLIEGEINNDLDVGLLTPVEVTKTTGPVQPGSGPVTFEYIIEVENLSAIAADPVLLEDQLPAWATYISDNVGGSADASGLFTANIGPLAANTSRVVRVLVEVNDADPSYNLVNTAIVNRATVAVQTNAFVGDYVFQDVDGDNINSLGDAPVPGATVYLYDGTGSNLLATTTTDISGLYGFIVPAGTYTVGFAPPPGTVFVAPNVGGDDTVDSDADPVTGLTNPFTLAPGEINRDMDAGVYSPLLVDKSVSAPLPGSGPVTFDYLIQVANASNLPVTPAIVTDTLPAWATYVSDNAGGSVAGNVFTADLGTLPANTTTTVAVRVAVAAADASLDLVNTAIVNNLFVGTQTNAMIGDWVFIDNDQSGTQTPGDTPVPGTIVHLYDATGTTELAVTNTSVTGEFFFIVPPGEYTLRFDPPAGSEFTTAKVGGDDTTDSDPDTTSGFTSSVTVAPGEINRNLDAGIIQPMDVEKTVSGPVPGSGLLTFDYLITVSNRTDLAANPVDVRDVLPAWATYVSDDAGGSYSAGVFTASIGPMGPNETRTITVRVSSDNPGMAVDLVNTALVNDIYIAVQTNAVIGNFVFQDTNLNSIQDPGEPGVPGAVVSLYQVVSGTPVQVASTVTDPSGNYSFVVPPGTYIVEFEPPPGTEFVTPNAGAPDVDSDADPVTGQTLPVTVVAGEVNDTLDAGLLVPGIVSKTADAPEASAGNVTFDYILTVTNNSPLAIQPAIIRDVLPPWATYISNDSGGVFAGGELTVDVGPLAGNSSATVRVKVSVDPAAGVSLVNTAIFNDVSIGTHESALIGDYVFLDVNENGIQDIGDLPQPGVTVELYDATGTTLLGTTVTDSAGNYEFIVPAGSYVIRFVAPPGTEFTLPNVGSSDADSDANASGFTPVITVANGETNTTVDAGLIASDNGIQIQKTVYAGDNGVAGCPGVDSLIATNGTRVTYCFVVTNTGRNPLTDVTVTDNTLTPAVSIPLGTLGAGQSVTTSVSRIATDDLVNIAEVTGRPPTGPEITSEDDAEVDVINPDLLLRKTVYAGHDGGASCEGAKMITATNGAPVTFCFVITNTGDADLSNVVLSDNDIVPPVMFNVGTLGVGQSVTQFVERTVAADIINTATGTGIPPVGPPVIGVDTARVSRVGVIGDHIWEDTDGDGIQDPGEPGLPGVVVELLNDLGVSIATTTTDPSGNYQFTGVPPGTYSIRVTPPAGYSATRKDQGGDDATDSDINPGTNTSDPFVLPPGVVDTSRDAGLVRPGSITGQVREDQDGDGDLTDPDPTIPGVTVELYEDPDCDGIVAGPPVATTTTSATGSYQFDALQPGCYVVVERDPTGYYSTGDRDGGTDNRIRVEVTSGTPSTGNDFLDSRPGVIGDFVWEDLNGNGLQDPGEPGIPNVTVHLRNNTGTVIATTTTTATGAYVFTGVLPGSYSVQFDLATLPPGFVPTTPGVGPDNTDSDADATGETRQIIVVSGESMRDLDMGAYRPVTLGDYVWIDQNGNGLQDPGEPPAPGVTVVIFDVSTGTPVRTIVTDPTGLWQVTDLPPGNYYLGYDPTTFPPNTMITPKNIAPGEEDRDSDADPVTGLTDPTGLLPSGTVRTDLDLGLAPRGFIGDTVWEDVNENGIPDENLTTTGIPGILVELYAIESGVTSLVQTTTTSAQFGNTGYYAFSNLAPRVYMVRLSNPSIPAAYGRYTTPAVYTVDLTALSSSFTNDFGLVTDSTAIDLAEFAAVLLPSGVRLTWRTASETDNFGFHVYRSARLNGERTRVNGALIEGQGTGSGATYSLTDVGVPPGRWFYWLEDLDYDGTTTTHGPVIVTVPEAGSTEAEAYVITEPGVYSIAPIGDAAQSQVEVDGVPVASALIDGQLLFYVGAGATSATVVTADEPLRMEEVDVAPKGGELAVVEVEEGGSVVFTTVESVNSYLVIGFGADIPVLLDITDPKLPRLLVNYGHLSTGGDSAAYLSHDTEEPARIHAVQQQKIKRLAP